MKITTPQRSTFIRITIPQRSTFIKNHDTPEVDLYDIIA